MLSRIDSRSHGMTFLVIFAVVSLGIAASGFVAYRQQRAQIEQSAHARLAAIADAKVRQVVAWRGERLADARVLAACAGEFGPLRRVLDGSATTRDRGVVLGWLHALASNDGYVNVTLVDSAGAPRFALRGSPSVDPSLGPMVARCLDRGDVEMSDVYRNAEPDAAHLSLLAPVDDLAGTAGRLGCVVLRINSATTLDPIMQALPSTGDTLEVGLSSRRGDEVVGLTPLRFLADAALRRRTPITRTEAPLVKAALGFEGIAAGLDYRNRRVVAAVRRIPDSPWVLGVKQDAEEVYASARSVGCAALLVVTLLIGLAGSGFAFVWRSQTATFYKRQYKAEAELVRANRVLRVLSDFSPLAARAASDDELFASLCSVVVRTGAYGLAWVGLPGEGEPGLLRLVACAGHRACPSSPCPCDVWTRTPLAGSLRAELLAAGQPVIVPRLMDDPRFADWRVNTVALDLRSCAFVAVRVPGNDAAVLAVCSLDDDAFDERELALLGELAERCTLGLDAIRAQNEQTRAQGELQLSEQRFRALFDGANDAIFVSGLDGRCLEANSVACHRLGYTREELLGLDLAAVDSATTAERIPDHLAQLQRQGSVVFEGEHRRRDGTLVPVEINARLFDFSGRTAILSVVRDISERRRLEAELVQAQKLESVGRLAGGVAHDFNNLLTVINGYSDLVLDALDGRDPIHENVLEIRKAGTRAAALTQQLLAFSRKQVLQPQRLDVNHLLADVERMLRRLIGEDVRIETRFARDLGTVLADPGQLSQVLLNLAVNARDAMPQGGTLTLATSNITVRDWRPAHDRPVPPGDYVTISVEDTGVGMSDEVRKHIFEPFFTTKEKGRGTGLGLSTAYGIISQSGGHIAVDTRPLRGTRFDLYLPRVDGVHDAAAAGPAGDALVMGGHETVLVTEDQTEVRRLACSVLRSYGYRVIESANADEALEWCGRDEVAIDLLVTDVVMPGLSGRELADRVQRVRPALKVLFMSGYTEEAIVHHGVLDGSVAYLAKPFTPQALALKVRQVLGAQRRIPA